MSEPITKTNRKGYGGRKSYDDHIILPYARYKDTPETFISLLRLGFSIKWERGGGGYVRDQVCFSYKTPYRAQRSLFVQYTIF